jgi:hypothetical protein
MCLSGCAKLWILSSKMFQVMVLPVFQKVVPIVQMAQTVVSMIDRLQQSIQY